MERWYEPKFGLTEGPIDAFWRRRSHASVSGWSMAGGGEVYAPFGLSDVFSLFARPNPVLAPSHVYQAKTGRWLRQWPGLTILP